MARGFVLLLGALLGCAIPAAAQDMSPGSFPTSSALVERADPDESPARREREEAAARADRTACDEGKSSGCAALGLAYLTGAGVPQNRPLAEVLLREACDADEGTACMGLGQLYLPRVAFSEEDKAMLEQAGSAFDRGCRLGVLDACERVAAILDGTDEVAADALRRDTCAKGGTASCRRLADDLSMRDESAAAQTEAQRVFARLCRSGDRESCVSHARWLTQQQERDEDSRSPELREIQSLGCRAGDGYLCHDLAMAVFAEGSGPPEQRVEALALFDRACDNESDFCSIRTAIHARPLLVQGCEAGRAQDCYALGELYQAPGSPLESAADARAPMGKACEGGIIEACTIAAELALQDSAPDAAARAERWYRTGCAGGQAGSCIAFGRRLVDGDGFPRDPGQGYPLLASACASGRTDICDELETRTATDPEAPVPVADNSYLPDDPEALEERQRRINEENAAERRAWRESVCTSTAVTFRGTLYEDTICDPLQRLIGGYRLRPGQAPWQALLWRPERLGTEILRPGARVACGGAMVATGWILTAAHCIVDKNKKSLLGPGHRIRLGVYNPQADEGVSYPILRAIPHPRYHEPSRAFDIALVRIDPRSGVKGEATNSIRAIRLDPVSLDKRTITNGLPVYTYGWGLTALEGETSTYLKGAKLRLEDPAACTRRTKFRGPLLEGAVLCASAPDNSQACYGDSGGPLITYGDTGNVPTVIAVVSAGEDCGTTGVPSRYTRIAKVRDWIDDTMAGRPHNPRRR
ncbi:trypsin-like serine protease [Erythrobacter dokdonensis]|uniref:Peptidase S1 domain-containing protein n=1 Tax=Erythrobacter dokdonensis DSW-74 TaxID=1300349 RepID=A0A1A7BFE3_9SPHN|nr:trypsin-like serine protease [Erythrobacter dokdonensis]OBV11243.1 hypothetical protein I603_1651 [Erythrobacter dokdonensis DSW-74]